MRFAIALQVAAFAGMVAANGSKKLGGGPGAAIFARQTEFCTDGDTCAECFGEGNVPCQVDYCYNPTGGEQCCGDGTYCIGDDTSCCGSVGAGETAGGSPAATPTTNDDDDSPASTTLSSPPSESSSWDCEASDSNEECCQRGDDSFQYCAGGDTFAGIVCYDPSAEVCCSDGTTCTGDADCCGSAGAAETSSIEDAATSVLSTGRPGVTLNTNAISSTRRNPTATGATDAAASSTNAANVFGAVESAAAIAAGVLGLALL